MDVVAKFVVESVGHIPGQTYAQVIMRPVYPGEDKDHVNTKFWEATPSGRLEMTITNRAAFEQFKSGETYVLTFVKE